MGWNRQPNGQYNFIRRGYVCAFVMPALLFGQKSNRVWLWSVTDSKGLQAEGWEYSLAAAKSAVEGDLEKRGANA